MKKNKTKLIVAIIIVVIVAIALISGVVLYLTTDLFKSNQELFLKYLSENDEMIKKFAEDNTKSLEQSIKQNKYITDTEVKFNLESNEPQIANQAIPASNFSIKSTAKVAPQDNKESSETTLKYLDNDLFTLKYIRNEDLYALKSDEVVSKYLAFDNNNIKEFAKKIGITDTTNIPNKLGTIKLQDLLYISEQDRELILDKYTQVVSLHVSKDKFKSEKNVVITSNNQSINTTEYSLELTQKEISDLLVAILETLKTDDDTLNIILSKISIIDVENTLTIDNLKAEIQEIIDELTNENIIPSDEIIKLSLYVNNGELVRTQIENQERKIFVDYTKKDSSIKMVITFEGMNDFQEQNISNELQEILVTPDSTNTSNMEIKQIEFASQTKDNQKETVVIATFEMGQDILKVSSRNTENVSDIIENNTTINVNISDNIYFIAEINSVTKPSENVEIEELTKENSATVNNFTPEYISTLSEAIVKRLQSLYIQKLELVTRTQQQIQNEQQNTNNNNEENSEDNTNIENNTVNEANTNNI